MINFICRQKPPLPICSPTKRIINISSARIKKLALYSYKHFCITLIKIEKTGTDMPMLVPFLYYVVKIYNPNLNQVM